MVHAILSSVTYTAEPADASPACYLVQPRVHVMLTFTCGLPECAMPMYRQLKFMAHAARQDRLQPAMTSCVLCIGTSLHFQLACTLDDCCGNACSAVVGTKQDMKTALEAAFDAGGPTIRGLIQRGMSREKAAKQHRELLPSASLLSLSSCCSLH